ncbi:MAG TPA: tetratricopeptide repeat protein, partial [Anaerolineae bacterium]|nr:tetratricopeptide repeat protein [Anaerolineae bacterium]
LSANPAHPLCLFLDDLHWADRSTLDLLHYLVRHLPDAVWFVGTYRPEEVSLDHPLVRLRQGLSRDHRANRLALAPLSAKAVADIARVLVGEESGSAFGDRLYRESEGNPFILIETVRDWQEQGLLHRTADGHWRWAGAPSATLPLSVQEVILQRVGRLSETAQRLLALAAVIGRHFDLALLRAAATDAPAVDASLDEWLARRLILQPAACRLQPATRNLFDFSHDKIRATVYHALGTGRRRLLHRRVGEALERLHSQQREAVYEQLAYHYEQAGAADPAWTYLLRAGDKAAALYAHPEALGFYDRALALAADDDRRRETLLRKGRSLLFLNRYEEAIACWQAVIGEGEGDALAAQAANDLSNLHYQRREYEPAYHWAGEAQRWAVQSHDPVEESRAWQMLAQVEQRWGDLDQARQRLEEALAAYRELDDEQGAARCLDGLGRILAGGGRQAEARDYFEQALTAYRTLGDRRREAACLRTIGITHWREGDNEAARRALVASQEIYRAIGDRQGEAAGLNSLGLVYIAQGDRAETQRCWEESAAIYRTLGLEKRAANVLHNLAILHLDRGEYAAARRYLEESLAVNLRVGDQLNEAMDRGWLGKVHLLRGEYGLARRHLEKAVTLDREAGGSEEEGWHHTWLGAVAYEQGDLAAAQDCLATARRCVKAHSASLQRQDVYRWLTVVSLAQGQGEAALDAAHRALAEAERLGKPPADQALLGTVLGSGLVTAAEDPIPHFERALSLLSPDTPFEYGLLLRRYGAYLLRHGQPERGAALLQEAQTLFAQIGAGGEEEKVRRLLAGDETPQLGW